VEGEVWVERVAWETERGEGGECVSDGGGLVGKGGR